MISYDKNQIVEEDIENENENEREEIDNSFKNS
jgi:hypothetical protein